MYLSNRSVVEKNSFHVELLDERTGREFNLSVYPPKASAINKLRKADTESEDCFEQFAEILAKMMSSNKENIIISGEDLMEIVDVVELSDLTEDFFKWVNDIKKK